MNNLHKIKFYPPELNTLSRAQKSAIVQQLHAGNKVRIRITPIRREMTVEYWGLDRYADRNTWRYLAPDYRTDGAYARHFDLSKVEVMMGRK